MFAIKKQTVHINRHGISVSCVFIVECNFEPRNAKMIFNFYISIFKERYESIRQIIKGFLNKE